jgi:hypothetical protein
MNCASGGNSYNQLIFFDLLKEKAQEDIYWRS